VHRRRERRQPETAPELQDPPAAQLAIRDMPRQGDATRPELRPIRQKLLVVECRLVDQLLCARRPQNRQASADAEVELLLD
jgi:hypothetical protein